MPVAYIQNQADILGWLHHHDGKRALPAERGTGAPGEAGRLYAEALACARSHRDAEAYDLLQRVLWLEPHNAEALSWFGLCMARLRDVHELALALCKRAAASAPQSIEVRTNLGRVQRLCGHTAAAHRSFMSAYRQDPNHPAPAVELARMGVRRPPVLRFLPRAHWCNRVLGRARHRWQRLLAASGGVRPA